MKHSLLLLRPGVCLRGWHGPVVEPTLVVAVVVAHHGEARRVAVWGSRRFEREGGSSTLCRVPARRSPRTQRRRRRGRRRRWRERRGSDLVLLLLLLLLLLLMLDGLGEGAVDGHFYDRGRALRSPRGHGVGVAGEG